MSRKEIDRAGQPMLMATGENGFSLSKHDPSQAVEPRIHSFVHTTGTLSDVLPKFRSNLKSKSPTEDHDSANVTAEVGAYISPLAMAAREGVDKRGYYPRSSLGYFIGQYRWDPDPAAQVWRSMGGGSSAPAYFQITSARARIYKSMRYTGSDCSPKVRQLLKDAFWQLSGDQCGHILAKSLGGTGTSHSPYNMNTFPQLATINQGSYNQFEQNIGRYVDGFTNACCCTADLHWWFYYSGNSAVGRPYGYYYSVVPSPGSSTACQAHFRATFNIPVNTSVLQWFSN